MTAILHPDTLRTESHQTMLETLRDWTSDPVILKALWSQGYGSPGETLRLGTRIKVTLDGRGETGLSEKQAARCLMVFLGSRRVRQIIAKRGQKVTGEKRGKLRAELMQWYEQLRGEYGPVQMP